MSNKPTDKAKADSYLMQVLWKSQRDKEEVRDKQRRAEEEKKRLQKEKEKQEK